MRKVIVSIHTTLDGFMSGPIGDLDNLDWLYPRVEELSKPVSDLLNTVDTILMGRVTYEGLAQYWPTATGEFFLQQRIEMDFMGFKIQSLELIGYDPATQAFASNVYANMAGTPLPYKWDFKDNNLKISMEGANFNGTLSEDGHSFSGGWRPEPGKEGPGNVAYDVVGTRLK